MYSRRVFFQRMLGLLSLCGSLPFIKACTNDSFPRAAFLSAATDLSGQHYIGSYSLYGRPIVQVQLSHPGHGMQRHPLYPQRALFFSRGPGTKLHLVDFQQRGLLTTVSSAPGRHFYGHGCFSQDGKYLFTSENNFAAGVGVIGVRDSETLKILEEFPSGGIGPHDLCLMPGGSDLAVANSGVKTHPDRPREKLNLETMQSLLSYIDINSGQVQESFPPEHPQLSIRHIDVNQAGNVLISMQFEGSSEMAPVMIAAHQGEANLQFFDDQHYDWSRLANYCGSAIYARCEGLEHIAAVCSPRGGKLVILDMQQRKVLADFSARDISGLGYAEELQAFIVSSGTGALFAVAPLAEQRQMSRLTDSVALHWDNHLQVIPS